ncbi:MAG: archaeal proteasome endopeptidase complex subunit alpha [Thaumarchaeota archaeon]|nr:archaeal proteasome endopeptidase complex subunit alpha [Nitrososphaerota archaeon]MCL5317344.1 archaeal proteasome endopeptidase complex subunit alpha [Nitrososphaerota archaeon]
MFPAAAGYDRAITVFSPDGRLYQVEYAIETVRRGTLAVGIKSEDGVVLAVEEKSRKLQNTAMSQKIFQVDDHLGVVAAGYIPDARVQVDQARVMAQSNRLVYDEIASVETVARRIADLAQQFTQYAGVRPFGVSLIIGGVDKTGPELFLTDPSGTYMAYDAVAIGAGSEQVTEYLEKSYAEDLSLDDACVMAVDSIYLISEDKSGSQHIKMALIDTKTKKLRRLSQQEIEKYTGKAKNRQPEGGEGKSS